MRNYNNIVNRINLLSQPYIHRRVLGQVDGYPILCLTLSTNQGLPTMLINGGTHGDEPAGVEAVLAFLNQDHSPWLNALCFEVIPCFNPYGYVHNTRHNPQGIDINWAFFENDVPEIQILRRLINKRRFEAVMDLHEDWESPGYYMYEVRRGAPLIGPELVRRVSTVCPVNTNSRIETMRAQHGVISFAPDSDIPARLRGGIPVALFEQHTDHLITSETPTEQSMESRVQAHLIALRTMIETHAKQDV